MSWLRPVLNGWLKVTERRFLARIENPQDARVRFERMARFVFRGPRGATYRKDALGDLELLHVAGPGADGDAVILYFHGGGYFFGSPNTHRKMLARLSQLCGIPAILPDYGKAPEAPFPRGIEDALAIYTDLLRSRPGAKIILGGDSAGGGLSLALLHEICEKGLDQPAMTFAIAPWVLLSDTFPQYRPTNASEVILPPERLHEVAMAYADGASLQNPLVSPVFGTFDGAGEVLILVSDSEILFEDSRRMTETLIKQEVPVRLVVEKGLPHVWPIFHWILPEGERSLKQVARAIRSALNLPPS